MLVLPVGAIAAVGITAPAGQSQNHNGSDANQSFTQSTWTLSSTEALGATLTLSAGPFTHSTVSTIKRDTRLDLAVLSSQGAALWAATVPTSQTNIALNVNTATVAAKSSSLGGGTVGLTVTFMDTDYSTLAAGNYTLTVTGTIVPNL